MAKLDGIKVVSENTVEYNGFVYGLVTEGAKTNDLIQCFENDEWLIRGEFYYVYDIDSDGDMVFNDEEGDSRYRNPHSNSWKVFRISHEITINKLTDAEGVVKIELPDGTKLEGTPSDLEKITRKLQEMQAEQRSSVEIKAEVEDGSESVSERLQIGDYAKVVGEGSHSAKVGDIVKIFVDDEDNQPFKCEDLQGKELRYPWFREHELVKATDEEVLEAKQALLKEGDFARVVGVEHTEDVCGPHEFEVGTVLKLHEFDSDDNTFETRHLNGEESDAPWVHRKDLEPLTKEEAEHITREAEEEKKAKAERDKWAAIGREVGEIKDGDIVLTVNYGIVEITSINDEHYRYSYDNKNGDRDRLSKDATLELIVPVEQRFDTVG
ncbi:hypothetical protein [Bacillus cereus]